MASYSYFCSMTGEKKSLCGNDWLRQRKEIAVCPLGWGREGWEGAEASTDCGRQINRKDKKLKVKNPKEKKNPGFDNEADKRRNTITTAGNWRGWGKLYKLRWKVGKGLEMNYRQSQKRGTQSIGRSFSWELSQSEDGVDIEDIQDLTVDCGLSFVTHTHKKKLRVISRIFITEIQMTGCSACSLGSEDYHTVPEPESCHLYFLHLLSWLLVCKSFFLYCLSFLQNKKCQNPFSKSTFFSNEKIIFPWRKWLKCVHTGL